MRQLLFKIVSAFILTKSNSSTARSGLKLAVLLILIFTKVSFSLASETYRQQEINYIAPKSATVLLVWNIEGQSHDVAIASNVSTKLSDGLLYTPMVAKGDMFSVCLNIPIDATVSYSFWITKNKQGQYEDYWDPQSGGKTTVTDTLPITKNAIYWKEEARKEIQLVRYGWIFLLVLLIPYSIFAWKKKQGVLPSHAVSYELKVLLIGISLFLIHALARAEIIDIHPLSIRNDFTAWGKIMKVSWSDLIYVGGLTAGFMLVLWRLKKASLKKWLYRMFQLVVIWSTLICLTNITTVIFLGKPLTYQWLYYSDFLGSREVVDALQENLSIAIVLNLIFLCIVVFIFAGLLGAFIQFLSRTLQVKKASYAFFGGILLMLMIQSFYVKSTWTKGQEENPVTAFAYSMVSARSDHFIYSLKLPEDFPPFDPREAEQLVEPVYGIRDERVKNVLLIVLESAGAQYFDGYGGTYTLSPNLNKYAAKALRFDKMYAHTPASNKSMVSILGSMYPHISYKSVTQEAPAVNYPSITSVLKKQGYRTSFFSSGDLTFQNSDQYLSYRNLDRIEDYSQIQCSEQFQINNPNYKNGDGIDDLCLEDRLTAWLDEDTSQNFFSLIWTVQGHYPYYFAETEEDFGEPNHSFNRYLNVLKHNDELVGNVMQALESRGLDSTTLVVVTGDHGEAFGQHGQYGHGTAIYEENLRVPLYFINPILFHGEVKNDIASMKDLATTILPILDITTPDLWQGRDLMQTNLNEAVYFAPWSDYLFGYRKDNMKFIFNETTGSVEIYNLDTDNKEQRNLFSLTSKNEISHARLRIGAWVQYQNKFMKKILKDGKYINPPQKHDDDNL